MFRHPHKLPQGWLEGHRRFRFSVPSGARPFERAAPSESKSLSKKVLGKVAKIFRLQPSGFKKLLHLEPGVWSLKPRQPTLAPAVPR